MNDFQRLKESVNPNSIFYRGLIEDNSDPKEKLYRCKVRILGIHTEDKTKLKTEDLPWAEYMIPNTRGIEGVAEVGTWVWVFFDKGNENKPIIFGKINVINPKEIDYSKGFSDPLGLYPREIDKGKSTTNRLSKVEDLDNTIHKQINNSLSESNSNNTAVSKKKVPTIQSTMQNFTSNKVKLDFNNTNVFSNLDNYKNNLTSSFTKIVNEFNPNDGVNFLKNKLSSSIDNIMVDAPSEVKSLITDSLFNILANTNIFAGVNCILNNLFSGLNTSFNKASNIIETVENVSIKFKQSESTNDKSVYPNVYVQETPAGHIFEIDDTPNNNRIRQYHSSGTFQETKHDGSTTTKVVGHNEKYVVSDDLEKIQGNKVKHISGNNISVVDANSLEIVNGNGSKVINGMKVDKVLGASHSIVDGEYSNNIKGEKNESILGGLNIDAGPKVKMDANVVHITKKVFLG